MAQAHQKIAIQKITLSSSRDIPFSKLVLSQSNVRRVRAGVSIEELAAMFQLEKNNVSVRLHRIRHRLQEELAR